jgi:hypothetical protein
MKKLNPWLKAFLIVVAIVMLGIVLAVVGGAYWWNANGAQMSLDIQAARSDGQAAGRITDYQGCVEQAAVRVKALSSATAVMVGNGFIGGCMETAAEPSGFCSVPSDISGMRDWRQQRCGRVPEDAKNACGLLVGSVQQLCKTRSQPKG